MALIGLFARTARSTNRSTPDHGDHGCQLQNVTADRGLICRGYGRRATWSIWTTRCSLSIVQKTRYRPAERIHLRVGVPAWKRRTEGDAPAGRRLHGGRDRAADRAAWREGRARRHRRPTGRRCMPGKWQVHVQDCAAGAAARRPDHLRRQVRQRPGDLGMVGERRADLRQRRRQAHQAQGTIAGDDDVRRGDVPVDHPRRCIPATARASPSPRPASSSAGSGLARPARLTSPASASTTDPRYRGALRQLRHPRHTAQPFQHRRRMPHPAFRVRPQRLLADDRAPRQEQPRDASAPAAAHDLGPEERVRAGPHSACFHRATPTHGRVPLHPGWGHAPRLVRHEDFYFRTSRPPAPPGTAARSRTHVRRWLTMRGNSSLPPRWPHPNPASVSLHLGGRQNRAWGLTVIPSRHRPESGKDPPPGSAPSGIVLEERFCGGWQPQSGGYVFIVARCRPGSPPDRPSGPALRRPRSRSSADQPEPSCDSS
jgi:hypothetical protein